jgi:TonB family protein
VREGITKLSVLAQDNVRQALREGRIDDASTWIRNAIALDTDHAAVAQLRSDFEVAKLGSAREDHARLLLLASQRIAQGRLVAPAADSARHYLDLLRAADPAYAGLSDTGALLATHSLAELRGQLAAGNLTGTDELLKAAADFGAPPAEVAAVAAGIAAAREPKPAPRPATPAVLPDSAMRRMHLVEPRYPARALEQGIEGWVDMEFTVATDGSTRDAIVRAAEPLGIFDRAALEAVARWRYEPRMINGSVVEQRVAARVRFQLKD